MAGSETGATSWLWRQLEQLRADMCIECVTASKMLRDPTQMTRLLPRLIVCSSSGWPKLPAVTPPSTGSQLITRKFGERCAHGGGLS